MEKVLPLEAPHATGANRERPRGVRRRRRFGAATLIWRDSLLETTCVGWRDREAGLPIERDTINPHRLDVQTDHLDSGAHAVRRGAVRAGRFDRALGAGAPTVAGPALARWSPRPDRPGRTADHLRRPVDPPVRPYVCRVSGAGRSHRPLRADLSRAQTTSNSTSSPEASASMSTPRSNAFTPW